MRRFNNQEIREKIDKCGIRQFEVAAACGVSEFTFSRWLREELPPDKKERVEIAIEKIIKEKYESILRTK